MVVAAVVAVVVGCYEYKYVCMYVCIVVVDDDDDDVDDDDERL